MKLNDLIYFIAFLFISLVGCPLSAQGDIQAVTLQLDSITIRCEVLLDDPQVEHEIDLPYYSYYRDAILDNQGGHTGRLLHGNYQEVDNGGKLLAQGDYNMGLQTGDWKKWDQMGILREVHHYDAGRKDGNFQEFNPQGQLAREGKYQNGLLNGKVKVYKDGQLASIERYRQGVAISEAAEKTPPPQRDTRMTSRAKKPKKTRANKKEEIVSGTSVSSQSRNGLPAEVAVNLARLPKRSVAIFIVSDSDDSPLVSANVKIARYGTNQRNHTQSSGFSGDDGVYYLLRDSADYVITVNHPGYEHASVRINKHDQRDNFLLKLTPKAACGTVAGSIQRADVAVGLGTVHLIALDKSRQEIASTYSDLNGNFKICLPCGQLYQLQLAKDNYHSHNEELFLTQDCQNQATQLNLLLNKKQSSSSPPRQATRLPGPQTATPPPSSPSTKPQGHQTTRPPNHQTTRPPDRHPPTFSARQDLPSPTSTATSFSVVAGTFSRKPNADRRLAEVRRAGFTEAALEKTKGADTYMVIVGQFTERGQAVQLNQQFRRQTQLKAYVREN